jgi:hypothetical protein
MPSAISWNAASQNSSSSAASQPASKRPPEITAPSSLSLQSSYGCDKCPHYLALQLPFFEVMALSFRLVGSAPERPCDDVCGLNPLLSESDGDAADFLD